MREAAVLSLLRVKCTFTKTAEEHRERYMETKTERGGQRDGRYIERGRETETKTET
jgi:hypothetical protein